MKSAKSSKSFKFPKSPPEIAQMAQLSMLMELSSSPKPGNVDRCHDHPDMGFNHFLVSCVLSYPTFEKAASEDLGIGALLLNAVDSWKRWGLNINTHFGEMVILLPLVKAAAIEGPLESSIRSVLEKTTVFDSIHFYEAFNKTNPRVADVNELSLKDQESIDRITLENKTLLDLMKISKDHDLIAKEWSTCYLRTFKLSKRLADYAKMLCINDAVVMTFLSALAEEPDTLIKSKYGTKVAMDVSSRAESVLKSNDPMNLVKDMDQELLTKGINPGSTADITSAAIFVALFEGLKF